MVVCVKQVVDPEIPTSSFHVDRDARRVATAPGIPPVLNGFDENAVEAALRIKEQVGGNITVLSVGEEFVMDVMKKPLSMGADQLVLVQDEKVAGLDSFATVHVLAAAIRKIGDYDLVLCGRQASDWDNAQVPQGLAEVLDLPCITVAEKLEIVDDGLVARRVISDGYEVVESEMPALVTVTNELGQPRYATLRGIMAAGRKTPTVWAVDDLGLDGSELQPRIVVTDLYVPVADKECEIIQGESEADSGRILAMRLREDKLI
jgi:electron transfer flavoprotein beta subunit